jgi:hypothetical protein
MMRATTVAMIAMDSIRPTEIRVLVKSVLFASGWRVIP